MSERSSMCQKQTSLCGSPQPPNQKCLSVRSCWDIIFTFSLLARQRSLTERQSGHACHLNYIKENVWRPQRSIFVKDTDSLFLWMEMLVLVTVDTCLVITLHYHCSRPYYLLFYTSARKAAHGTTLAEMTV